jgi:S1-C subfamily serine protease
MSRPSAARNQQPMYRPPQATSQRATSGQSQRSAPITNRGTSGRSQTSRNGISNSAPRTSRRGGQASHGHHNHHRHDWHRRHGYRVFYMTADGMPMVMNDAGEMQSVATGVRITEVREGEARRQGMLVGDIILSVNGGETPTVEALAAALQEADGEAEVVFRNSENGAIESIVLYPVGGRIGIQGETVTLQ